MSRHLAESAPGSALGNGLTWLGGGYAASSRDTHDRSAYQVTGLIVLLAGLLAWLVATVAVAGSTTVSVALIAPFTLVVGLLVGAIARTLAGGRPTRWYGLLGRGLIALFIGVVLGELAAIGIFSGAVDRELDQQAVERTAGAPAVVLATDNLDNLRTARSGLDKAVDDARVHMNEAFIRANCEFNPQPTCPPGITGVPGSGPQTRSANEIYLDAKDALALAESNRDQQVASLDTEIAQGATALAAAKAAAPSDVDRGLSGRWTAMHDYTVANLGAMMLRLLTITFFAVLMLLPLLLKLWRGETLLDRSSDAEAVRQRAEIEADTEIALKRAAVRAEAEKLWAEQKLTSARFAAEAETAIEREHHRRRVAAAFDENAYGQTQQLPRSLDFAPVAALPAGTGAQERTPIADAVEAEIAEAELADAPLDYAPGREIARVGHNLPATPDRLPAVAAPKQKQQPKAEPAKPPSVGLPRLNPLPDLARTVTGIGKSLVPDVVKNLSNANPVKSARSVFEEFEEIKFSFSRKRTVTMDEQKPDETAVYRQAEQLTQVPQEQSAPALSRIHSTRVVEGPRPQNQYGLDYTPWNTEALGVGTPEDLSRGLTGREGDRELVEREGPAALDERQGPRALPSA